MPSYSLRERTSGAIYAGVPTVDLGLECSRDDYKRGERKYLNNNSFHMHLIILSLISLFPVLPLNNQNHRFSDEEQGSHPTRYSLTSNLDGIFAENQKR